MIYFRETFIRFELTLRQLILCSLIGKSEFTNYLYSMNQILIVFDIDGTLTDSMDIHHEAFMLALEQIGVTNYIPFQREFKHFTDSFVVKDIFEFSTNEPFTEIHFSTFSKCLTAEILKHEITEILGAKELVSHLNEK